MIVSTKKTARFGRAKLAVSLTGAVLAIGSGVAQADPNIPNTETRTMKVSYADLNLSTPEGVERLHQRIQSAARTICGSPYERQLDVRRSARACYKTAVADAVATVEQRARLQQRARLHVYTE